MRQIGIDRLRRLRYWSGGTMLIAGSAALWVAPRHNFSDEPVGWLLIAASVLLLLYRNYIEVNPVAGRLAHRTGFGFAFIRKRFDIGTIKHLKIDSFIREVGEDDDECEIFVLEVKGEPGGRLCQHEEMFAARLIAEQVARALGVPLENGLFGGRSVRKPEDLDMPLAERWRRSHRLKAAPIIDADSTLVVSHGENASEISMPVPKFPRSIVAIVGALLIAGFFAVPWIVSSAIPFWVPFFVVPAVSFVTITLVTRHSGRDRLRFDATSVCYRRGLMPSVQRMNIDSIEEILEHGDDIVLMGDRDHIRVDRPEAEHERKLLRQFIERQISRRQDGLAPN